MAITFGNQLQVDSAASFATVIKMTATTAICFYSDSTAAVSAKHLTLSGDTITAGAKLAIDATATATSLIRAARLTDTVAIVAYHYGTTHRARIITVSGTTLSAGGITNLVDNTNIDFTSMSAISTSRVIYCYSDSSSQNGKAVVLTNSGGSVAQGLSFTYDANSFNNAVIGLSASQAVVIFTDGSNNDYLTGEVLDINTATVTGNSDVVLSTTAASQSTIHRIAVDSLDSTNIVIVWSNSVINALVATVSGGFGSGTLTTGTKVVLPFADASANISVAATSDSLALVVGDNSTGLNVCEIAISGTGITRLDNTTYTSTANVAGAWIAGMSAGIGIAAWDASAEVIPVFADGVAPAAPSYSIENNTNFILDSIEGDGDRGGWQATARLANDQGEAIFERRTDIYWTPEGDGVWADEPILGITGSVIPQSVRFDIRQSATTFTVVTTDNFLAISGLQGIYFSDTDPATNPHQYTDLRLGTIIKHIIEQHSNISSTGTVQDTDGTDTGNPIGGWVDTSNIDIVFTSKVNVFTVRQSNSLWQALKQIAANEFYVVYMSKDDKFNYEPHPVFKTVLDPFTLDIDADMIIAQPEVQFRDQVDFDQVELMALTDDGEILRSKYPDTIAAGGRKKVITNLRCNDQNRLDNLAQRSFSFETRLYNVRLQLPGAAGLYLELFDRVSLTYTGTARNGVDLSFSAEPFFVNKIRVSRQGNFGAVTELELEQENIEGAIYA